MPALFLTEAKITFEVAMAHFDFPALPGPEDERRQRQQQPPLPRLVEHRIDQIRHWLTVFAPPMFGIGLPAHDDQKQRALRGPRTQKGTFASLNLGLEHALPQESQLSVAAGLGWARTSLRPFLS